jgi:hypothetical protein
MDAAGERAVLKRGERTSCEAIACKRGRFTDATIRPWTW